MPTDAIPVLVARARADKDRDDRVIAAALRILERRLRHPGAAFRSPSDVRNYLRLSLAGLEREVFVALWLDAQHRLIARDDLFTGTLTQTSVYPREVVKAGLRANAAACVLVHNHPSGEPDASMADRILTESLKRALALVDVNVLDHFIVAGDTLLSFCERGLLDAWSGRAGASGSSGCREKVGGREPAPQRRLIGPAVPQDRLHRKGRDDLSSRRGSS